MPIITSVVVASQSPHAPRTRQCLHQAIACHAPCLLFSGNHQYTGAEGTAPGMSATPVLRLMGAVGVCGRCQQPRRCVVTPQRGQCGRTASAEDRVGGNTRQCRCCCIPAACSGHSCSLSWRADQPAGTICADGTSAAETAGQWCPGRRKLYVGPQQVSTRHGTARPIYGPLADQASLLAGDAQMRSLGGLLAPAHGDLPLNLLGRRPCSPHHLRLRSVLCRHATARYPQPGQARRPCLVGRGQAPKRRVYIYDLAGWTRNPAKLC